MQSFLALLVLILCAEDGNPYPPMPLALTEERLQSILANPPENVGGVDLGRRSFEGSVIVTTPYIRVALAARRAKERYQQLPIDEARKLAAPNIEVLALPNLPESVRDSSTPRVEHLVIVPAEGAPIQPTSVEPIERSASNAFGVKVTVYGLKAAFPIDAMKAGGKVRLILDRPVPAPNEEGRWPDDGNPIRSKDIPLLLDGDFMSRLQ